MTNRIVSKLSSNSGESIAELLISILVSVLGITLLAIMIQTSSRLILSSTEKIKQYTADENKIVSRDIDEQDIEKGQANFVDSNNKPYRFYKGSGLIEVNIYKMSYGNKEIIAFGK